MNRPDQFERFVLPDGVRKYALPVRFLCYSAGGPANGAGAERCLRHLCCRVTYEKDTKVVNAAKVKIEREDHTLGNLLRM